jgi:hypothetical protein
VAADMEVSAASRAGTQVASVASRCCHACITLCPISFRLQVAGTVTTTEAGIVTGAVVAVAGEYSHACYTPRELFCVVLTVVCMDSYTCLQCQHTSCTFFTAMPPGRPCVQETAYQQVSVSLT